MDNVIYHYQHCSKCVGALHILRERGIHAKVVDYMTATPTRAELAELGRLLGVGPFGMMRTSDKPFADLGLSTTDRRTDQEWFDLIIKHPILLQRPIVVIKGKAIIARPAELVLQLLE